MKIYILIIVMAVAFFSCQEKNIGVYDGERYLYFSPLQDDADSVLVSFSNYPTQDEIKVKFVVNLVGDILPEAAKYRIDVVDSVTTALPENYRLELTPTFRADSIRDTLTITLVKTDKLTTNVYLGLQIASNENFAGGVATKRRLLLVFNNVVSKPLWWNKEIEKIYLGKYSEKKFREFVTCTGINDLTHVSASWKREYALKFKAYIEEHQLTEEDGKPMVVPIY